jgi:hypothetical protein
MIVMVVTYFYGCWWLPVVLSRVDSDKLKLGREVPVVSESAVQGGSAQGDDGGVSGSRNSDVDMMRTDEYSSPLGVDADTVAAFRDRVSDATNSVEPTHAA